MIICIAREYGSGGHNVARKLAEMLNIPYYDKKLIDDIQDIGLERETLEKADETRASRFFSTQKFKVPDARLQGLTANDIVFQMQCEWICKKALEGPSVIVGRCADYVLRQTGIPYVSVFVTAPFDSRVDREMHKQNLTEKDAIRLVQKMDKQRQAYYDYYTEGNWGKPNSHDICINTATYGIDRSAEILYYMLKDDIIAETSPYTKRRDTI